MGRDWDISLVRVSILCSVGVFHPRVVHVCPLSGGFHVLVGVLTGSDRWCPLVRDFRYFSWRFLFRGWSIRIPRLGVFHSIGKRAFYHILPVLPDIPVIVSY